MPELPVNLLGYMGCPQGLVVTSEALGRKYTSRIDGVRIELYFPKFRSAGLFASCPDPLVGTDLDSSLCSPDFWGIFRACGSLNSCGESSAGHAGYVTVLVRHVGWMISAGDTNTYQRVSEKIEDFWRGCVRWCAVVEEPHEGWLVFRPPQLSLCEPRLAAEASSGQKMPTYQSTGGGFGAQERGFSSATLAQALDSVGRGIQIPLPWELLLDARSHFLTFDFRRSVIDSCSACETAYAQLFLDMKGDSVTARRQLDKLGGIIPLVSKLRRMLTSGATEYQRFAFHNDRLPEPEVLKEVVAKPRNRAVHEGDALSDTQARAALAMANRVVQELLPNGLLAGS